MDSTQYFQSNSSAKIYLFLEKDKTILHFYCLWTTKFAFLWVLWCMDNIIVEASKFHSNSAVAPAELKSSVATDDFLRILDDHVKKPHENPSIGIVICKSSNKELVEYVIQDYHNSIE